MCRLALTLCNRATPGTLVNPEVLEHTPKHSILLGNSAGVYAEGDVRDTSNRALAPGEKMMLLQFHLQWDV